jgi:hypothetical protein
MCNLKSASRTTRQNDGLKRIKRHPQAAEQSADKCRNLHEKVLYPLEIAIFVNLTRAPDDLLRLGPSIEVRRV